MGWIDTVVIIIVIALGLIIFYKALKEPLDMLFGLIGRGIRGIVDSIHSRGESNGYDIIRYGG